MWSLGNDLDCRKDLPARESVIEQKEIRTGLLLMISSHPSPSQMPTKGPNLSEMPTNGFNQSQMPTNGFNLSEMLPDVLPHQRQHRQP